MSTQDKTVRPLATAYLVLAAAMALLDFGERVGRWTEFWAVSPALGFALVAIGGIRWVPLVLVSEILRVAIPELLSSGVVTIEPILTIAATVVFYSIGAATLRKLARGTPRFGTVSTLNWFLLVTLLAPLGAAAMAVLPEVVWSLGAVELLEHLQMRWSAGAAGLLATVPAVLLVAAPVFEGTSVALFDRGHSETTFPVLPIPAEIAAQVFALGAALFLVFGLDEAEGATLLFFLFPPLIWIAFSYGVHLASLSLTLTLVASTVAAEFAGLSPVDLPVFPLALLVATASTLTFGTMVTLQRLAEQSRLEQEESFRRLAEAAFEGILVQEHGLVVQVNFRLAEMVGLTPEETLGREVLSFVAPEYRSQVRDRIQMEFEGTHEADLVRHDGHRFPVEISGKTYTQGSRRLRVAAIRDITERRL